MLDSYWEHNAALFTHISVCISLQSDFCVHVNIDKQVKLQVPRRQLVGEEMIIVCLFVSPGFVTPLKQIPFDVDQIIQSHEVHTLCRPVCLSVIVFVCVDAV